MSSPLPLMSVSDRRTGTRQRLISAAIAAIAEYGYAATAVADVISRAGCARATFYQHFRDREDCLLAALEQAAGELLARLRHGTREARGVHAARSLVSGLVTYVCEERDCARLLLLEGLGGGHRALGQRDRLIRQIEDLIEDRSEPARGDRQVLALPTTALVGGTFRLLTIRVYRGATDQNELRSGLLAWIDAYLTSTRARSSVRQGLPPIDPAAGLGQSTVASPPLLPRGRHRVDAAEAARNQRERILYATLQAAYEYTYPATTVEDIIAYAGVSKRAFYRHFRDRRDAASQAYAQFFEQAMAATAGAFFAASGWPRQVWAAGHALTSFMAANPIVARSAFVEFHSVSPDAIQLVYDRLDAFTLFLEQGYSYRERPRLCSETIAAVMFEFAYRAARRHPAGAELPNMIPTFTYVCLAPFLGPDRTMDVIEEMATHTLEPFRPSSGRRDRLGR